MKFLSAVRFPLTPLVLMLLLSACASQDLSETGHEGAAQAESAELREEVAKLRETSGELQQEVVTLRETSGELQDANRELEAKLRGVQTEAAAARARSIELEQALAESSELAAEAAAAPREAARDEFPVEAPPVAMDQPVAMEPPVSPRPRDAMAPPGAGPSARSARVGSAAADGQGDGDRVVYEIDGGEQEPTLVPLFYGTNRARMNPVIRDYLKPFLIPALAVLLLYLLVLLIRRIVKTEYQKPASITVSAVLLAVFGWQLLDGIFKVVQMRQADRLNPVQYGPLRLEADPGGLPFELGTCTVSIPPGHVPGRVELPDMRLFEFRSDPAEHFVLRDISPLDPDDFHSRLKARVAESDEKDMFVFVHGFHNTFQDAAFRTAQIAHDLDFKGVPVFFSWPSQGTVLNYSADENNVRVAVSDLKLFLQLLRGQSGAGRIHLIAHSMGSRALTRAIESISLDSAGDGPAFNEMVLAAPDIDAKELDQMAEKMARAVDRVTLYASSKDEALAASRFLHGQTYQRAGETEPRPLVNQWIQTIDVSYVTSGHSYIADNGRVLSDLDELITHSREIDETVARKVVVDGGYYWQLGRSQ